MLQGAAVSDTEVEEKTSDDPHKLLDINLDEYVQLSSSSSSIFLKWLK